MAETGGGSSGEGNGGEGGDGSHAAEVGGDGNRLTLVDQGRRPMGFIIGGPQVHRLDPQSGVEGLVVTSGGLGEAGGSSSSGGVGGDRSGLPPRDSTSGKDSMVEEEIPRVAHVERVEFMPPVGTSSHEPIMSSDLADIVGEAALARLMRENLAVVEAVLATREESLQQIARANEEERLMREEEALATETVTAEKAREEGAWAQEATVTLAESIRQAPRAKFVAETYTPPEPHLFIPFRVEGYLP
ncbi:hypothetical protein RHMOL_Rhmol06G0126300 [Rhododendron molle]|uniref:Uncharacterized protein n=1 Tax=Rhododendron molle TaxID=49168 RepID=A0ACC0NBR1_RHOML|nr:hypothetical protein RHMOL_Rhmol06G0126300 [Rhododendron molle]